MFFRRHLALRRSILLRFDTHALSARQSPFLTHVQQEIQARLVPERDKQKTWINLIPH